MQANRCNKKCDYFRWGEVGDRYKEYCMKDSQYVKDIGACPLRWATTITNEANDEKMCN